MKYIRTKDEKIYKLQETKSGEKYLVKSNELIPLWNTNEYEIIKQADTIEELCDEFVIKYKGEEKPRIVDMIALLKSCKSHKITFKKHINWLFETYKERLELCVLAIWTDKGLIYVAKMNEKGELELI